MTDPQIPLLVHLLLPRRAAFPCGCVVSRLFKLVSLSIGLGMVVLLSVITRTYSPSGQYLTPHSLGIAMTWQVQPAMVRLVPQTISRRIPALTRRVLPAKVWTSMLSARVVACLQAVTSEINNDVKIWSTTRVNRKRRLYVKALGQQPNPNLSVVHDGCCSLFGGPLKGQDLYLGAAVGDDGCVYGIPGSARHVLKITGPGRAPTASLLPTVCNGNFVRCALKDSQFKWLRGVPVNSGETIYGIPANAEAVLKVVPRTGEVSTLPMDNEGAPLAPGVRWKWHGAVLAHDGNIYAAPANADSVLMIVPRTGETRLVPLPRLESDERVAGLKQRWYGALLSELDNAVYCIPFNAGCVLRIEPLGDQGGSGDDPASPRLSYVGHLPTGGFKWHGGVIGRAGQIFGVPSHASRVLRIRPRKGGDPVVDIVGSRDIDPGPKFDPTSRRWQPGKYKYGGGVAAPDGNVFCLPYDAQHVLKIATSQDDEDDVEVTQLPCTDPGCTRHFQVVNKWQNGFVGRDGKIYGIPVSAPAVLRIDPSSGVVDTCGRMLCGGEERWEGGAVHPKNGAMYCVPQNADGVLLIDPTPAGEVHTA